MAADGMSLDGHVHFFTASDLEVVAGRLPFALPVPHLLSNYLAQLAKSGVAPKLLNNVHLSVLPDSSNVFASFEEMEALRAQWPGRYDEVRLVGTIKADPTYATAERLSHPQVVGIRVVLHDAPPESISDHAYGGSDWLALLARLRTDQHVHVYAKEAETNLRVLRQIPDQIRVVIDHLGTCHPERGEDEPSYHALLQEAGRRGNVWFKGPGYRTSTKVDEVVPFVRAIIKAVSADRVLLSASDAPHVGTDNEGVGFASHYNSVSALEFCEALASSVSFATGIPVRRLLSAAADDLFPIQQKAKP
ncbi:amidohydrolase family protein [Mesorhizobium sp. M0437]|uniref:amidohydrolase family protein n=1 Tax=Mesorhizobium sp. M0437 TaxID=2956945 RepID=UPI0033398FEB